MTTKQKTNKTIVSPAGEAQYPWLNKPSTKFNEDGVYQVLLRLKTEDHQEFVDNLKAATERAHKEKIVENPKNKRFGIHYPFKDELDEDGNETGYTLVNFKQYATGKNRKGEIFNVTLPIYDSKGKPVHKNVGSGSVIKVAFEPAPVQAGADKYGLTLRMKAVQVLDLKEWSRDAKSFGFGEEDGFEVEETEADTTPFTPSTASAGSGDAF
jgi:hypothetical protein